ncbi:MULTISPECIES: 16S rRNA (guanine(966)-N(2))-methyltransferase RsmD [Brochothrix]|uniref:16S rRNA (Guanine(966)-N(2))-methyltransferase RsmD n=1 Tax=Brochothrix thermosphacta TaxID=2756 RepID=A0A1D2KPV4_BROTH|nr:MULTISPECIES: 16S rRNA (guanine(966)-N(2))-methyltransferase RsmD [Brochothrix]ATF25306.1 16S rRNA (guanine(966)-N(2))-methyltransferase RsmD [Brochothrix thermosphacta]ATH84689.1 16S rRNA (guanine(966)-N(2))-methyltransferase RsmD [Brochothrix thermosphacta]MBR5526640.1 16S rRNA (guanine(966)-N(2))-methyltransferase RsmD [Brochothrix sp.]MPQ27741.1 16S rRNA (guanine(966)-N(2))-methyltransferase RsmD [Brochothrix thermosphacta]ODJ47877.1 16S rRNA (guanine(966)-N(2))-methyltransferase RsmD [
MRVVAGSVRNHQLKAVPGDKTRPTTDKIKESMFNIIGPYFDGGKALDLFAGSGGLGIEALSRGIEETVFVDQAAPAIKIIQENIAKCHLEERAIVKKGEALQTLKQLGASGESYQLIFLDPPYNFHEMDALLIKIEELKMVTTSSIIIVEHEKTYELEDTIGGFKRFKQALYGITSLSFYELGE